MSEGSNFSCDACGKSYAWKPAIAGKKAKCKCGATLTVPTEEPEGNLDDLYALAPEGPVNEGHIARVAMPAPVAAAAPSRGAGGAAVGYQRGPTAREKELDAIARHIDPIREIYVPVGLMLLGVIAYLAFFMVRYEARGGALALMLAGISIMTFFKMLLLIGFAFMIAGPLGVSFGGMGTAALKLAAIAIFSDGVQTWLDHGLEKLAGNGIYNYMFDFFYALGVYWVLIIYLFNMDNEDAWQTVIALAGFNIVVRWILVFLLMAWVLSLGGVSAPSVPGAGSAGGSMISEATEQFNELKQRKLIHEGMEHIADGHQISLKPHVQAWYDAGAVKVYFTVDRDMNGHEETSGIVIELPKDANKRKAIFDAVNKYYSDLKMGDNAADTGEKYEFVDIL